MLHLARKAFFPGPLPFPLLHVDTTGSSGTCMRCATGRRASPGIELIVHQQPRGAGARASTRSTTARCTPTCGRPRGCARRSTGTASTRRSAAPGATRRRAGPRSACSASATGTTAGIPKRQRPELWSLYNVRKNKGESMRVFPLSNWTELDVWQYIQREGIEVVPLYFARRAADGGARRPDPDGRRRAHAAGAGRDGRSAAGAVPDAGLLPAVGRGRERGGDASRRSSPRCWRARPASGRAARSTATPAAHRWRGRSRRAISEPPCRRRRLAGRAGAKELLRFITCGRVDDGKSTLIGRLLYETRQIFDDQLAALEGDSKRHGTQGEEIDFALLVDGLVGRARAGHHHRRRLSLFREREAQVHRRRYAGARAIYAQHGDRRLDRRPRGDAGRCAQGRADPDAAALLPRARCSASATSCSR